MHLLQQTVLLQVRLVLPALMILLQMFHKQDSTFNCSLQFCPVSNILSFCRISMNLQIFIFVSYLLLIKMFLVSNLFLLFFIQSITF